MDMRYIRLLGVISLLALICLSAGEAKSCDCSDFSGTWTITRQHFEFSDNTKNIEPTNKLQEQAMFNVAGCIVTGTFGNGGIIEGTSKGGSFVGKWSQGGETGDILESFLLGFDPDSNGERNCNRLSGVQTVKYGRESWRWTGEKVENVLRPDTNIGNVPLFKTFLVEKLHYTEGTSSDDWVIAPVGSVLLWGKSPSESAEIDHSTIVVSDYLQIGMEAVAYMGTKDKIPTTSEGSYYFRGILYPPNDARPRLMNPLNVDPVVNKYKDLSRYDPTNPNKWIWNCHGFTANIAYDLFGGESVLNPKTP